MADHTLKDRQDLPIWNAIEANNFKQALKLVDKRLAKKQTDYLEALKIYIRSRSPLLSEKSSVLIHLEELVERKPVLVDLEAIDLYDDAFGEVLPHTGESWENIIGEIRWQCVKATPKNEELALKCFQSCLLKDDLEHARQIANTLEKSFSSNRAYIFWNIATMFLYSKSPRYPEKQRTMWRGLSLGLVGKLATTTKQADDPKQLPARSIQTPQELLLLHRITEAYGTPEQRLEYLQDPSLGPESMVAKGEWQLWRFRVELLEAAQQWQPLFDMTGALLKRARTKDEAGQLTESGMSDWILWEAYIRSAFELSSYKYIDDVTAEVEAHLDPASGIDKSWRRNASLAWIKLSLSQISPFSNSDTTNFSAEQQPQDVAADFGRVSTVIKYLQQYGDASTAYNDLRPFVELLNMRERKQLIRALDKNSIYGKVGTPKDEDSKSEGGSSPLNRDLTTASKITQVVNSFKLFYLLKSSRAEVERSQSPAHMPLETEFTCIQCSKLCGVYCRFCLGRLAEDSLKSYKSAIDDDGQITKNLLPTDRHPADDLCILSAMCLVKLFFADKKSVEESLQTVKASYLLQATMLLEYAWSRSKSNFQISLLLVRLYSYLGCGSLSMKAFQRLAVKQIQLDTLSYTLFDRISTLHPHPFGHLPDGSTKFRSPIEQFQKQQKLYRNAREQVSKNIAIAFKHGSYNSIFEIREASEALSKSMSAAMSVVEQRRISRIIQPDTPLSSVSSGYDVLLPNPEDLKTGFSDTNDYGSFPNFESTQGPQFEMLTRSAPAPSEFRTRTNLRMETLAQILDPASDSDVKGATAQIWLKQYVDLTSKETHEQEKSGRPSAQDSLMTVPERLAMLAYDDIAHVILLACDEGQWSELGFQKNLDNFNIDLLERLEKQTTFITSTQRLAPAFSSTLHSLYIAYDVGRMVLKFSKYLSQRGLTVHETQVEASKKAVEVAGRLLQAVAESCAVIKGEFDEGGWIDKVLDSVLRREQDSFGEHAYESVSIVETLQDLVDENFREEWAGQVVESWRDSVVGFSHLKGSPKV